MLGVSQRLNAPQPAVSGRFVGGRLSSARPKLREWCYGTGMLRFFRSRRRLLGLMFLVALAITIFFGIRAYQQATQLRSQTDEPIRPWMNVSYIAHSYDVPQDVLYEALGLPTDRPDPRPVGEIARDEGRCFEEVRAVLLEAIREAHGPPTPPPPPPPPEAPQPPVPPRPGSEGQR